MEVPLVGRNHLVRRWTSLVSVRTPESGGFLLTGPPGVGKTRLLEELCGIAGSGGLALVRGTGRQGTAEVPLGALLDALHSPPHGVDSASVLWWATNVLTHSQHDRLLLALDDAHLCDPMSLALAHHLATTRSVVLLVTCRSTEAWPTGLTRLRHDALVEEKRIGPLDPGQTTELAEAMLGGSLHRDSARELRRLSAGFPLMVRELIRSGCESERLQPRDGLWELNAPLADDPSLETLLDERMSRLTDAQRDAIDLVTVADGVPVDLASRLCGKQAVALLEEHGMALADENALLRWSHPLLGELAARHTPVARLSAARSRLLGTLLERRETLSPPELLLAAALELDDGNANPSLQTRAASAALAIQDHVRVRRHARAAISAGAGVEPRRLLAESSVAVGDEDTDAVLADLGTRAASDEELVEWARLMALWAVRAKGDPAAAQRTIAETCSRIRVPELRDHLLLWGALSMHANLGMEGLAASTRDLIERGSLQLDAEVTARGQLAMGAAFTGDIAEALEQAEWITAHPLGGRSFVDDTFSAFGSGLAQLFAGDAGAAHKLVVETCERHSPAPGTEDAVGHATFALQFELFRGHRFGESTWYDSVEQADALPSLHYATILRICSTWSGALSRNPEAKVHWDELQASPRDAWVSMAGIEAIAGVALAASLGDVRAAADRAIELATELAEARGIAAWLLHDAARHGRAEEAIGPLRDLASSTNRWWLAHLFAASAEAMASSDHEALCGVAGSFRLRGFDLFAAEVETMLAEVATSPPEAAAARARARVDLEHAGNPWTPLVAALAPDPLTPRQREACILAAEGLSNREIAERMIVSVRTVENQLQRSYQALGVHDRKRLAEVIRSGSQP